jgi:zinc D-Ala-D-Ala carboxypeptidase
MKLSKDFTLQELSKSEIADRNNINNIPTADHITNLVLLCQHVLQPVRSHFDKPVSITSGYRSPELCVLVGSKPTSQHTFGQAADFKIAGVPNKVVSDWIVNSLDFDQCILEFWKPEEPNSGWVHCSYSFDNNRKEYLQATKSNGTVLYTKIS